MTAQAAAEVDLPSRAAVLWEARQTIRMHAERPSRDRATGCCKRCCRGPGKGCSRLRWAATIVRAHERPSGLMP